MSGRRRASRGVDRDEDDVDDGNGESNDDDDDDDDDCEDGEVGNAIEDGEFAFVLYDREDSDDAFAEDEGKDGRNDESDFDD